MVVVFSFRFFDQDSNRQLAIVSFVFGHPGLSEVLSKPLGNFQVVRFAGPQSL